MSDDGQEKTGVDVPTERLPVSVLTGFLGSGKTTLLKNLLRHPDMGEVAVVINEFGEVGLDHVLVEQSSDDTIVMDSGCLCCTIRGDLVNTLRDLIRRRWNGEVPAFNRLVIETTGLADPAPIIHTLMTDPVLSSRYRLDGIVTTVDAVNGGLQLDNNPESVKQAAVADRIVMTKTDMKSEEKPDRLEERIRLINPAAKLITASFGEVEPASLFDAGLYNPETKTADVRRWLSEEAYAEASGHDHHHHHHAHDHHHHHDDNHDHHHHDHGHHHDINRHDDRIRSFSMRYEEPIVWDAFVEWVDALVSIHGDNMLRMKGILNVEEVDGPVAVHGVQHIFHPPAVLDEWPDEERVSKIVIIARDLNREPIEEMLNAFLKTGAETRHKGLG